ncbi:nucleotidyltransferase [Bacillus phage 035JT004]|nr:nucleotidyltransferase [Bacillus phage 035JT004]
MEERKVSFKAVVGSYNYNLATPDSDVDQLHFVFPTFDDLYKGTQIKGVSTSKQEDIAIHDVRKLADYLCKGSPNFIETLFSVRTFQKDGLYGQLLAMRSQIITLNLPDFYNACRGMFRQQHAKAEAALFSKEVDYKVVGKHTASAMRISDLLLKFHKSGFNNYEEALWYDSGTIAHETLVGLKSGKADFETLQKYVDYLDELDGDINEVGDGYRKQKVDMDTAQEVQNLVRVYVEKNIRRELKRGN